MEKKKRGRGRPPNKPNDLITLDQAVVAIREALTQKYHNDEIVKKCSYSKGTLYNKTSSGEIHAWREGKFSLVSRAEILKLVG